MTRVTIVQPSLAKYRVPVYTALAQRPGVDLQVIYAQSAGIPNVTPDGFFARFEPLQTVRIRAGHMLWHGAQIRYATRERSDVLILSWDVHYASLIPALLRAKANGVATILWGHGYSKRERPWRAWLRQAPARLADTLLFYSENPARTYREKYGFDPGRVVVAPNALDQAPMEAARAAWLGMPDELGRFKETNGLVGQRTILFCSRLVRENRVDLLLRATAEIRKTIQNVRVFIVGSGEDEANLRCLVDELNLGEHIRFVGAIYDEMKLAPWFLSADVYCYPENIGLSLLHSFGYALPVVTSDRREAHNPEIEALRPNQNGLLYRHGDHAALAETLRTLLANETQRNALAKEAQRTVTEKFSLEHMVDGFAKAIELSVKRRN